MEQHALRSLLCQRSGGRIVHRNGRCALQALQAQFTELLQFGLEHPQVLIAHDPTKVVRRLQIPGGKPL